MVIGTLCKPGLVILLGCSAPLIAQGQVSNTQKHFEVLLNYAEAIFKSRSNHPIKRTVKKYPYDNDPSILIEYVTESFDGFVFDYQKNGALLSRVRLSKPTVALPLLIQIGDTKESVLAKVGKPNKNSRNQIEYVNAGDGYPNSVTFHFNSGKLKSIEWSFIID